VLLGSRLESAAGREVNTPGIPPTVSSPRSWLAGTETGTAAGVLALFLSEVAGEVNRTPPLKPQCLPFGDATVLRRRAKARRIAAKSPRIAWVVDFPPEGQPAELQGIDAKRAGALRLDDSDRDSLLVSRRD
jgi:hypothetical protein